LSEKKIKNSFYKGNTEVRKLQIKYISNRWQIVKSFYTGIGKSAVLLPAAFLVAVGVGTVALGMIFYVRDVFAATPSQVGYLTALWSLHYILGCLFIRQLFNRVLPHYLLIASTFFMTVFVLSTVLTYRFFMVYVFYSLWGVAMSLFWPFIMGWLSHGIEGVKLGKVLSNYNFSWSIGTIISPFLAGILSTFSSSLPLFLGSFLFFLTCVLIIGATLTLPKIKSDRWIEAAKRRDVSHKGRSTLLRFPSWIGLFTTYTVVGVVLNIFPIYARTDLGMSKNLVGLILQQRAIFATLGFIVLGRTSFWHFKPLQMIIGQILLSAMVFLLQYTSMPFPLGMLLALIGILMSLSYFNSLFHGVSGSVNRAGRMAIHESILSAGLIIGSLFGGLLYERYTMSLVYLFCAGLVLFGAVVQTTFVFKIWATDPAMKDRR